MLAVTDKFNDMFVKPWAYFCKFQSKFPNGQVIKTDTALVYFEGEETKDQALWRIQSKCTEYSGKYGIDVDLIDYQLIYQPKA
jgi:hypothetical protein